MACFHIVNFGCRATQADSAAIEAQLRARGYAPAAGAADAAVVVVNTCTVTASADSQARQAIRAIHRERPQARIVVTGCYAQRAPEDLAALPGVSWVVGNSHKPEIPHLIDGLMVQSASVDSPMDFVPLADLDARRARVLTGNVFALSEVLVAPIDGGEGDHTRPTLKIQDGCDSRCAFCVIPFVRGRSRSLAPELVIEEIRRLVARGAREIVLSGINLGSYGRDLAPRVELLDLLRRILVETHIERLRLSSIEPMDVTRDLIELFASTDRLAPHFHIPLQSGSDRVLAAMRRWYRAEHYARRAELVRELLPGAGIGADVIAGFPGETDADHHATVEFIRALPFTYLHVFPFSARPGTRAATLPEPVQPQVARARVRELRALADAKRRTFREAQLGRRLRVLTLKRQGSTDGEAWTAALAGNYVELRVAGRWPRNQFLEVVVQATEPHVLAAPQFA